MIDPLQLTNVEGIYDPEDQILIFTWKENVTAKETAQTYEWTYKIFEQLPSTHTIIGTIADFSAVKEFAQNNLRTARKKSKEMHQEHTHEVQQMPAAFIVSNLYQEMYLSTSMKIAKQSEADNNARVRIVSSLEEARRHIEMWHADRKKSENS